MKKTPIIFYSPGEVSKEENIHDYSGQILRIETTETIQDVYVTQARWEAK